MLDAQGKEIRREKLRNAGGISYRMAPPPDTSGDRRGNFGPHTPLPVPADLPVRPPNTAFGEIDWNEIEVFLETNVIRVFLNAEALKRYSIRLSIITGLLILPSQSTSAL